MIIQLLLSFMYLPKMLLLCKCIVIILIECVARFQDALLNQLLIRTSIGSFFFTSRRRLEVYHHQMEWEYMLRLDNTDIRDRKVSRKLSKSGEKCSLDLCCLFYMDLVEDSTCKQYFRLLPLHRHTSSTDCHTSFFHL